MITKKNHTLPAIQFPKCSPSNSSCSIRISRYSPQYSFNHNPQNTQTLLIEVGKKCCGMVIEYKLLNIPGY